jgi:hypothetical protein
VVAVRLSPVLSLVSVTFAPAMTCPDGSVTVPTMVPVIVWAYAETETIAAIARIKSPLARRRQTDPAFPGAGFWKPDMFTLLGGILSHRRQGVKG